MRKNKNEFNVCWSHTYLDDIVDQFKKSLPGTSEESLASYREITLSEMKLEPGFDPTTNSVVRTWTEGQI